MKIEIWSDIMCPFCYIGKRKFEQALKQFEHRDNIEIEWKSFQLQPDIDTQPEKNVTRHLAEVKGWSIEQADQMNRRVTDMAEEVGLEFNFDKAIVANSFNAHRLIKYAGTRDKGNEAKEILLRAYFTEGKNIDDYDTLIQLATEIGLYRDEIKHLLESNDYTDAVKKDIQEARKMNIHGVPFFLFNRKYAISGAQQTGLFIQALNKSWNEWKEKQAPVELSMEEGATCVPGETCQ